MLYRVILSLGSNYNEQQNMAFAVEQLKRLFLSIRFSESYYTDPVGSSYSVGKYLNQVAVAYTGYSADEIKPMLKEIEAAAGRSPQLKAEGKIPLDVDLVKWSDQVLKPADLQQDYVLRGLSDLQEEP
ncbi:MAG: 2-amino-4-hydroxy-6-hydroxymethyldihydropteridine diphosphokinase [Macellibacteroides fermentans]|uniref:2-amino-4-hydroxy-6- hydroxymethyldihydropteridine diphosphokinase n=1 Tax=Macellibacteroides fermentans TaxID=879969 RepID=UPI003AC47160